MLVLAMSACSSSDSEEIYGVWLTPGWSDLMSFNEDGSWEGSHPEDPERIRDWGTFTFDGELLTFTSTDPSSSKCSPSAGAGDELGAIGTWEVAFTAEGDLELTDVEDPCVHRSVDLRGTLVPYSP
jgi:hypothetical protein